MIYWSRSKRLSTPTTTQTTSTTEKNSKLVTKIDDVIDEHNESRDIYEMEHSNLIDLLNTKFEHVQHQFGELLHKPIYAKSDITDETKQSKIDLLREPSISDTVNF